MELLLIFLCIFVIQFQIIIILKMFGDIQKEELEANNYEYEK